MSTVFINLLHCRTKRAADECYGLRQQHEALKLEHAKLNGLHERVCEKLHRMEEHRQKKKERKAAKEQQQQQQQQQRQS
jgi:hypothetical protein